MKLGVWLGTIGLGGFFFSSAYGTEGVFNNIHHQYQSTRAMGMGDAFVAVANDASALFYNPAGLARTEETTITWGLASVDITNGGYKFYQDVDNAANSSADDVVVANNVINVLQANYGKPYAVRATASEVFVNKKNFAFAFIPVDVTVDMAVHNQAAPSLDVRAYGDTTLAIGVGYDVKDPDIPGRLSWGITGKAINREYLSQELNTIDLVSNSDVIDNSDIQEGYTFDADLGLLYTPYIPESGAFSWFEYARPTFGVVARNIFDLGFTHSLHAVNGSGSVPPERLYRVFDAGLKFEFPAFAIFTSRAAIDIRDMGHPDFNTRKGLHLGYEVDWAVTHWLRGQAEVGVNEDYPTFGLGLALAWLKLQFVTYGEDVGSYDAPKENRMYGGKVSLEF